jgi:hypothetical protein
MGKHEDDQTKIRDADMRIRMNDCRRGKQRFTMRMQSLFEAAGIQ